jgi:hypothetical protein
MKLSTVHEDVSVVNVWHQIIRDINNTCMEHFFIVSFWLKKHSVSDAASASAIGQSMRLISLQPLQHILDYPRGRAVFVACFHMLMEAHTGCETTFYKQSEMVEYAQCLCQFNITALTHVLASM